MSAEIEIDEIDTKILKILLKDARTKQKDIARDCNLSSNAIFKRIKRLKATGLIIGATTTINFEKLDYTYAAGIEVIADAAEELSILKFLQKHANISNAVQSFGASDMVVLAHGRNELEIDELVQAIKNRPGVKGVAVYLFIGYQQAFPENLDIQPKRA
jgi:Lrp/AsnC family transcriptional regulator for asnA, asnC and gidA